MLLSNCCYVTYNLVWEIFQVFAEEEKKKKTRPLKKISKQRLKNIALYYLQRFETSTENLRQVLQRRLWKYACQNPDFDVEEAKGWIEEILLEMQNFHYVDDKRFAELKVKDYMAAGKSLRYISQKLKAKGIDDDLVASLAEAQDYDPQTAAMKLAKKKHLGPYRQSEEERQACRQKDMRALVGAGFDYETVMWVLDAESVSSEV